MKKKLFLDYNVIPVLNNFNQFKKWLGVIKNNYNKQLILHFDTGMNRLGFQKNDIENLKKNREILYKFKNVLFMSHLACADDMNNPFNLEQKTKFDQIKKEFPGFKYSLSSIGWYFFR